ncbi:MAG: aminopeptidase P family protein [Lachnospiraceae bacterium]|nr:aminopeptidase P family protein [Lachnospiraceae bacterium]
MEKEIREKILSGKSVGALPVDALLITNPANMRYTAGFTGEGYVYLSEKKAMVVTDSRYTLAAAKECPEFQVVEWDKKGYYYPLSEFLQEEGLQTLGMEDESVTVAEYEKLQKELEKAGAKVKIKGIGDGITKHRAVKSAEEIACIRRAEAIGDRAFERLLSIVQMGMTEKQAAAWLEFFLKEEGADGLSFDTIAASGIHSAMPHAVPTNKPLESGDFLTLDFGCRYRGYCSDMTRTLVMGKASDRQKEIYDTVLRAQERALAGIRPGMSGKEVDALARDVIREAGYGDCFGHSLGHSLGLDIHEKPAFSPKEDTIIQPGMVITVEPGVYIEDFGGVRIEDVVVITEAGCENITHSSKEFIEIMRSADV